MSYKVGIAIAMIFLIVVGVVVYSFLRPVSVGSPTHRTQTRGFMKPIKIGYSIAALVPSPSGPGAGALYLAAYKRIKDVVANGGGLSGLLADPHPDAAPEIVAIVTSLENAAEKTMTRKHLLFIKTVRLPTATDTLSNDLDDIGQLTGAYATACISNKHPKKAAQALSALLVFGHRLWRRGLFVDVRTSGLSDIASAAAGLRMVYRAGPTKDQAKFDSASKLMKATDKAGRRWYAKVKIVDSLTPNPGDMANIVRHDQDLSWRIDALLELGIARWNTRNVRRADAIAGFLEQRTHDPNHWIRAAAKVAYSMTADTMNTLGSN